MDPFLAKQVRSLDDLEGFERVRSSVLIDKAGFEVRPIKFKAVRSSLYLGLILFLFFLLSYNNLSSNTIYTEISTQDVNKLQISQRLRISYFLDAFKLPQC